MKATMEIPDEVYRQVKAKSALEGRAIRDVTVELFRRYLDQEGPSAPGPRSGLARTVGGKSVPAWFGILREEARLGPGHFDTREVELSDSRSAALWALAACLLFLAVGALYGGWSLLRDPSGAGIQLPLELLAGSPFPDYRIPGAVLFTLFGLVPWVVVPALFSRRPRRAFAGFAWPWLAAFALAVGLVIWLAVQAAVIGFAGGIQGVYAAFALGLLGLVLAPSVRGRFRETARDR